MGTARGSRFVTAWFLRIRAEKRVYSRQSTVESAGLAESSESETLDCRLLTVDFRSYFFFLPPFFLAFLAGLRALAFLAAFFFLPPLAFALPRLAFALALAGLRAAAFLRLGLGDAGAAISSG